MSGQLDVFHRNLTPLVFLLGRLLPYHFHLFQIHGVLLGSSIARGFLLTADVGMEFRVSQSQTIYLPRDFFQA